MKKASRPRPSTRYLGLAIGFIMVVLFACAVWNTSSFDLWWTLGTFAAAGLITFAVIAPKLLPIEDAAEDRREAYRVFGRFILGQDSFIALVRDGQVVTQSKSHLNQGVIVVDSTSVVALRTSTGISRVAGAHLDKQGRSRSGVIFTLPEEEIDAVIDLRPQMRRKPTTAQTRDGITVEVAVTAFFAPKHTRARKLNELYQLKHRPRALAYYPPPFSWRRSSIVQALSTRRVEPDGEHTKKTDWYERIMEIAIPRLRDLISKYTVDELTAWTTTDKFLKHPRFAIRDELVNLVRREIDADDEARHPTGIEVRAMSVDSSQTAGWRHRTSHSSVDGRMAQEGSRHLRTSRRRSDSHARTGARPSSRRNDRAHQRHLAGSPVLQCSQR